MTDETNKLALADDPTDEQLEAIEESQPWRIDGVEALAWAMERLAKAEDERSKVLEVFNAYAKRLDGWKQDRLDAIEAGTAYLTAEVARYSTEHRKELVKGKTKSIDLPAGTVSWRKVGGKLVVTDREALTKWCIEAGPEAGLFRVKTEPDMRALQEYFKKFGEIPPGTDAEPETESISIKPSRPLLPPETLEIP